jgi:hypothetical protein
VALGDQLELAAARALARRRSRRQAVMNAAATLVVAVPLAITLATGQLTTGPVPTSSLSEPVPTADGFVPGERTTVPDDMIPRDLRRMRRGAPPALLRLPTSLRPALR